MTTSDIIKQLILAFNKRDDNAFLQVAKEYIEKEKRKKHNIVAKELEKALFLNDGSKTFTEIRFKNEIPIPRDAEKGFPLLEIQRFDKDIDTLLIPSETKKQLEEIIKEFKDADVLATYNLQNKKKILLCGKPGTGKTFSVQIISSVLNIPLVYIRLGAIISSYLGGTAFKLRKVFNYIESKTWIVLFDEFDVLYKNQEGNIFLQMLDNFKSDSIIFVATNHHQNYHQYIDDSFDDVIYYELPDETIRKQLFEIYLKPIKRNLDIDISDVVSMTNGLSPADIKMIVKEALKRRIVNSKDNLSQQDIESVIQKFILKNKNL